MTDNATKTHLDRVLSHEDESLYPDTQPVMLDVPLRLFARGGLF
jgi:hypothetical protein